MLRAANEVQYQRNLLQYVDNSKTESNQDNTVHFAKQHVFVLVSHLTSQVNTGSMVFQGIK